MTEEFKELLDRDRALVEARELIEIACPLLQELVNHASWAFTRVLRAADEERRGKENEDLAPYILYRQLIEHADAIEVLLSRSCVMATTPIVRSMFEASLALDFILIDPASYVQRSLCWTYAHVQGKIRAYELLDPNSRRGAEFQAAGGLGSPSPFNSQLAIANISVVAARPQFASIAADYATLQQKRKGNPPNWFSVLNGPRNRRELAKEVHRERDYLGLYGAWSAVAHAETATGLIGPGESPGEIGFPMVRSAKEFRTTAAFAASFLLHATRTVVGHFRPGESLKAWYLREIKKPYERLRHDDRFDPAESM